MATLSPDVTAALASLQARWGAAAPRRIGEALGEVVGEVVGALATVPLPAPDASDAPGAPLPVRRPDDGRIVGTGFAALDAIIGPGGVPRGAGVAVRGDLTSGKTTLALRLAAEAQASGSIVAYLDLARSFDPVEAVARGVRLEWLVVLTPESIDDGLAMAGSLVQGRAIDLLLVDLPSGRKGAPGPDDRGRASGGRAPTLADRLHRLAALARRADTMLVLLEPPDLSSSLRQALGESTGLGLELARRSWIRLGRDVVGQRTEVMVTRNRFGPPGRRAELRILYTDGSERDACLHRDPLLGPDPVPFDAPATLPRTISDAPPPPLLVPSPAPARSPAGHHLRLVPDRADRPGRPALGRGGRARHEPIRPRDGDPTRDGARERSPTRA